VWLHIYPVLIGVCVCVCVCVCACRVRLFVEQPNLMNITCLHLLSIKDSHLTGSCAKNAVVLDFTGVFAERKLIH